MKLYPCLRYQDPRAAVAWLDRAFGFERLALHEDDGGGVVHVEMRWGDSVVMFGQDRDDAFGGHAGRGFTYVSCDDPDGLFERAAAAGAEVVRGLEDTGYGSREFSVRDLEGNLWSFGTYEP